MRPDHSIQAAELIKVSIMRHTFSTISILLFLGLASRSDAEPVPEVLEPGSWTVAAIKGNAFIAANADGKPTITAKGKSLVLVSAGKMDPDTRVRIRLRFPQREAKS